MSLVLHFPHWLGDFVMALPLASALAKSGGESTRRIAVIEKKYSGILDRAGLPYEKWTYEKNQRWDLCKQLRSEKIKHVFLSTNSFGSIWPYVLGGVKERHGFGGNFTRFLIRHRPLANEHLSQAQKLMLMVDAHQQPERELPPLLNISVDKNQAPHLLYFPSARYGEAKRWDHESSARLLGEALKKGWSVDLWGTPDDWEEAEAIRKLTQSEKVLNRCSGLSLDELMNEVEKITNPICLSNDSGAMHLLAACGVPTLGLFFSTSSEKTPAAFGPWHHIDAPTSCRPCFGRTCKFGHYQCRKDISVHEVFKTLDEMKAKYSNS